MKGGQAKKEREEKEEESGACWGNIGKRGKKTDQGKIGKRGRKLTMPGKDGERGENYYTGGVF
jgi:hypothetical protein